MIGIVLRARFSWREIVQGMFRTLLFKVRFRPVDSAHQGSLTAQLVKLRTQRLVMK